MCVFFRCLVCWHGVTGWARRLGRVQAGVAIEIWTMNGGLTFDNIFNGKDEAAAADFASQVPHASATAMARVQRCTYVFTVSAPRVPSRQTWQVEHDGQKGKKEAEKEIGKIGGRKRQEKEEGEGGRRRRNIGIYIHLCSCTYMLA